MGKISIERSLAIVRPDLMAEWDWEANNADGISPYEIGPGSITKTNWVCSKGHKWKAYTKNRNQGCGCPVCSNRVIVTGFNDLATLFPQLLAEWDYTNNTMDPCKIGANSKVKVNWVCQNNKSHKWMATIESRTASHTGCPICKQSNTSFPEQLIYLAFKNAYEKVYNRVKIGGYEYDICIPEIKLLIEYDGVYWHNGTRKNDVSIDKENFALNNKANFLRIIESKDIEQSYLEDGIIYYRYQQNYSNIDEVLTLIELYLVRNGIESKTLNVSNKLKCEALNNRDTNRGVIKLKSNSTLCKEWDTEKNGCMPDNISINSCAEVWWICNKGHRYKAIISNRATKNSGCPYCSGRNAIDGVNDIKTLCKEALNDVDTQFENVEDVAKLKIGSNIKIHWKCHICNYKDFKNPLHRIKRNQGCPNCKHKYNVQD